MNFTEILISDNCYYLATKNQMFLILSFLHKNGKINDQSLASLFKSLNNDTLLRRVNTYHCKINNKWYNDEGIFTIYQNVLSDMDISKTLNLEECIFYVNKLLNKPRNYCIDHIYFEFVVPVIDNYKYSEYMDSRYLESFISDDFNLLDVYLYNRSDYDNYDPGGYCCEDCDGDYEEYKKSRFMHEKYMCDSDKKIHAKFGGYLDAKKKIYKFNNPISKISMLC